MTTFDYYKRIYHGKVYNNEEDFTRAALITERIITNTAGPASLFDENDWNTCVCAIADLWNTKETAQDNAGVKSETVGGWSRTFSENNSETEKIFKKSLIDYIKLFLGVDVRYKGVGRHVC